VHRKLVLTSFRQLVGGSPRGVVTMAEAVCTGRRGARPRGIRRLRAEIVVDLDVGGGELELGRLRLDMCEDRRSIIMLNVLRCIIIERCVVLDSKTVTEGGLLLLVLHDAAVRPHRNGRSVAD
jgi:hypothetical protein